MEYLKHRPAPADKKSKKTAYGAECEKGGFMYKENHKIEFQGLKKWLRQGEYIISTIADDGTIWTFTSKTLPIFDFGNTKIFQAQESGIAEVKGVERDDELYFSIHGIKVSKVYDFVYQEDL